MKVGVKKEWRLLLIELGLFLSPGGRRDMRITWSINPEAA